jgi:hypothetical protein
VRPGTGYRVRVFAAVPTVPVPSDDPDGFEDYPDDYLPRLVVFFRDAPPCGSTLCDPGRLIAQKPLPLPNIGGDWDRTIVDLEVPLGANVAQLAIFASWSEEPSQVVSFWDDVVFAPLR